MFSVSNLDLLLGDAERSATKEVLLGDRHYLHRGMSCLNTSVVSLKAHTERAILIIQSINQSRIF